jgi:hypothetical protein
MLPDDAADREDIIGAASAADVGSVEGVQEWFRRMTQLRTCATAQLCNCAWGRREVHEEEGGGSSHMGMLGLLSSGPGAHGAMGGGVFIGEVRGEALDRAVLQAIQMRSWGR